MPSGRFNLREEKVFINLRTKEERDSKLWIYDTGATNHKTGSRAAFTNLGTVIHGSVWFSDDSVAEIKGCGRVLFECKNGEHRSFTGIYFIPRLMENIVSLRQLEEASFNIRLNHSAMNIWEARG
jgi:hypothetical protein